MLLTSICLSLVVNLLTFSINRESDYIDTSSEELDYSLDSDFSAKFTAAEFSSENMSRLG